MSARSFRVKGTVSATLAGEDVPQLGTAARLIRMDRPCGTTVVIFCSAPRGLQLDDAFCYRLALLEHAAQEPHCRCIRRFWRQHFGCEWPEVRLRARGAS